MEFLIVASQKLAGGDSVNVAMCWWLCSKVKASRWIKPSPHWLESAPLTSEALVAQYLHGSSYLKQLIMQTVHFLQLEIVWGGHRFTAQGGIFVRQS
jgi:hypothetical protein